METIAVSTGYAVLFIAAFYTLFHLVGKLIPGKVKCALGFHDLDDSYCVREGCDYHSVND